MKSVVFDSFFSHIENRLWKTFHRSVDTEFCCSCTVWKHADVQNLWLKSHGHPLFAGKKLEAQTAEEVAVMWM